MFKKTLLALSVAGASLAANAGTLTVSVNETNTAGSAQKTAYDLATAVAVGNARCSAIATALNVTLTTAGFTHDAAANADAATPANINGVYDEKATNVTLTGTDACTYYVQEAKVGASSAKYSQEAAGSKGVTVKATQIAGIGGFKSEDTIVFTFAGVTIDEAKTASATLKDGQNNVIPLINVVNNTLIFAFPTTYTAGRPRDLLTLDGVVVTAGSDVTKITLSSETRNTSNIVVDNSAEATVTEIAKQYSSSVYTKGDGIVDVSKERFQFAVNTSDTSNTALGTASESVLNDTFVLEVKEDTTQGNLTPKSGNLVITGNFGWMMDNAGADGKLSGGEIEAGFTYSALTAKDGTGKIITAGDDAVTAGSKSTLNTDMTELTIPLTVNGGDIDKFHVVKFVVPGVAGKAKVSLNNTTFLGSLNFINNKTTDSTTADVALNVATNAEVAQWKLNGSVVEVPYLPFGPVTQPILRHTNTGAQTGDISVRYMVEKNGLPVHTSWQSMGVVVTQASPGVRDLLSLVTTKLKDAGFDSATSSFKVALEVTTNVPGNDVTVFAAAKVTAEGQDRLTVGSFKAATAAN